MSNPAALLEAIPQELAYAAQLLGHLPSGKAWATARDSVLWGLLRGLGCGLARAHVRGQDLEREVDPHSTTELIGEWEAALGLPDECTGPLEDLVARRGAVLARLFPDGGITPAALVELAAQFGYTITLVEHPEALMGEWSMGDSLYLNSTGFDVGVSSMGDSLGLWLGWSFVVDVQGAAFTEEAFVMGSNVGLPLRSWSNALLECVLQRAAGAHVQLRFVYTLPLQPDAAVLTLLVPDPLLTA